MRNTILSLAFHLGGSVSPDLVSTLGFACTEVWVSALDGHLISMKSFHHVHDILEKIAELACAHLAVELSVYKWEKMACTINNPTHDKLGNTLLQSYFCRRTVTVLMFTFATISSTGQHRTVQYSVYRQYNAASSGS